MFVFDRVAVMKFAVARPEISECLSVNVNSFFFLWHFTGNNTAVFDHKKKSFGHYALKFV